MKIIVSSSEFAQILHKSVLSYCKNIVSIPKGELMFNGVNNNFRMDVDFKEPIKECAMYTPNPVQMYELSKFLLNFENQPVCISFNQITDDYCQMKVIEIDKVF